MFKDDTRHLQLVSNKNNQAGGASQGSQTVITMAEAKRRIGLLPTMQEGLNLIEAFLHIEDAEDRQALVNLAEQMARKRSNKLR